DRGQEDGQRQNAAFQQRDGAVQTVGGGAQIGNFPELGGEDRGISVMDATQQASERGASIVFHVAQHERITKSAGAHRPRRVAARGLSQGFQGVASPAYGRLRAAGREVDGGGPLPGAFGKF